MLIYSLLGDYRNLAGTRIRRDCPVRLVYIDEAGRSDPKKEPYFVVSGVILNGDQDWQPIDAHLKHLIRKHIPEDRQPFTIFHTSDIWSGEKKFSKTVYKGDSRWKMLHDLTAIPKKFHLTICNGFTHREGAAAELRKRVPGISQKSIDRFIHTEAYMMLARTVDHWMKRNAPNEVAMLIAEDTDKVKGALKLIHSAFAGGEDLDEFWHIDEATLKRAFRTSRIIDTLHFAKKDEAPPLQIADTAAFFVKRQLMRMTDSLEFYKKLEPHLYPAPRIINGYSLPRVIVGPDNGLLVMIRKKDLEFISENADGSLNVSLKGQSS